MTWDPTDTGTSGKRLSRRTVECELCEVVIPESDAKVWSYDVLTGYSSGRTSRGTSYNFNEGPLDSGRRTWESTSGRQNHYKRVSIWVCSECYDKKKWKNLYRVGSAIVAGIVALAIVGIIRGSKEEALSTGAESARAIASSNIERRSPLYEPETQPQDEASPDQSSPATDSSQPKKPADSAQVETLAITPDNEPNLAIAVLTALRSGQTWNWASDKSEAMGAVSVSLRRTNSNGTTCRNFQYYVDQSTVRQTSPVIEACTTDGIHWQYARN